ncbi:hypothetical protein PAHAL_3G489400 [Panicum hallii]|uniref:Uncharacterized protein n=1 Tax=Panicum hallii TaxID=206008 RepID=A0A2T8KM22_9POAL|nr:hypothetical protein PAHAL_3G489400 [Panicum hallii]
MFIPCLKLFIFLQRSQLIRRRRIGERIVAATKPKLFLFQSRLSLIFVAARHSGDKRFTAAAAAISCLRLLGWLRGFRDGGRKSRGGKRKLDMEWMRCPRSDACGLGHGWPEPFCANRHGRQGEVALRNSPPCATAPFFPIASGSGNGRFVAGKCTAVHLSPPTLGTGSLPPRRTPSYSVNSSSRTVTALNRRAGSCWEELLCLRRRARVGAGSVPMAAARVPSRGGKMQSSEPWTHHRRCQLMLYFCVCRFGLF